MNALSEHLKTFCVGYIFALIAIYLLAIALAYFFDYEPSAGLGFVASFTGALWAGQRYAMHTNEKPASALAWRFALASLVPALLISGVVVLIALLVGGVDPNLAEIPPSFWIIGFVLAALVHVFSARFFFSFGAGNHLNAEANKKKFDK